MVRKKSKLKSRPVAGPKKVAARLSAHLIGNKKSQPKAQRKTVRNPHGFDLNALSPEQRKLHEEIVKEWGRTSVSVKVTVMLASIGSC